MDAWVSFTILGILSFGMAVSAWGGFVCYSNREGDAVSYRRGWLMVVGGGMVLSGDVVAALMIRGLS